MRTFIVIIAFVCSFMTNAQEKPVKIVFDVTSGDLTTQKAAVRHIKGMSNAYPESKFQLVVYSQAMDLVLSEKSIAAQEIADLTSKDNVAITVCAGTMRRFKTEKEDLIEGVEIVSDGIMEIIMKQQQGWGYIKESN